MGKILFFLVFTLPVFFELFAQGKETGTDREAIKQYMNNKDTIPDFRQTKNIELVKNVLKRYNSAVEALNVTGTERFFTADSRICESGSSEGNYSHYLEHHLTPELKELKSFSFSDYKVEVQIDGNYAFTIETYNYAIVLAKDNSEVRGKGATTSVLRKVKGQWMIMIYHNSSRK